MNKQLKLTINFSSVTIFPFFLLKTFNFHASSYSLDSRSHRVKKSRPPPPHTSVLLRRHFLLSRHKREWHRFCSVFVSHASAAKEEITFASRFIT